MEAYLDNAATTRASKNVIEIVRKVMEEDYGNPSSLHLLGVDAEKYVKTAREHIAATLKCEPSEIVFTSGGTESNNMALIGAALANRRNGKHIISTRIEHASVYNPLIFLEEQGFEVTYLEVDSLGHIRLEQLLDAIREDTILVSVMYVNNEVGAIEDIKTIGSAIKERKPDIIFHVDAIQAYGKLRIVPKKENIDLLSVSGHKIHGPKGSGFLYIKNKTRIKPIIYGGGQQKGMRSGTENVPGIAGIGQAAADIYADFDENVKHLYELKCDFIRQVSCIEGVTVNAVGEYSDEESFISEVMKTAPHVVSLSFDGVRSEVLLHALEDKGVYVSSGSACSSNHPAISGTLKAIGLRNDLLDSTLRFSFSVATTKEETAYAVQCLKELLPVLRKYSRK